MKRQYLSLIILSFLLGLIISCKLLDRVDDQKSEVNITLDYSKIDSKSLNKNESGEYNVSAIDKAELIIYDIDESYSTVSDSYNGMNIQSSSTVKDYEEYWVKGVEQILDGISSDKEDATEDLQVRWDWENNGTYDTNYATTKTTTHQYTTAGTYTTKLQVKDTGGLTHTTTKSITVSTANTFPTASFTVSPTSGTTNIDFMFDASDSNDNEDAASALQVRWDWTNDGNYDTGYSTTKIAWHRYTTAGTHTVKLQIKDSGGLTNTTTRTISVTAVNTEYSLLFDGNDYVHINTDGILGNNPRTIMYWSTTNDWITGASYTIRYGVLGVSSGTSFRCGYGNATNGGVYVGTGTAAITYVPISTKNNQYHHYAYVVPNIVSPTIGDILIYQDGILIQNIENIQGSSSLLINTTSTNLIELGINLKGNLDELSIWNRALTQNEIQTYKNSGLTGVENGLKGYWKFDEGAGNILYDKSTYGNDGTINGATWSTDTP